MQRRNKQSWGIPDLLTKWWPADLSARTWPGFGAIFVVKIVSTGKRCYTIIYWQGWFSQTMVVWAAGTFLGHSLNSVPGFITKVQCCWSWLRITGTQEFDCDPRSHCQLLCLYTESSSQQISSDTKRQAALWKSHAFKVNLCLSRVVCSCLLSDTMRMHPVNYSLIAPLREQLALKIKALREFSISGHPNCGLKEPELFWGPLEQLLPKENVYLISNK